MIDLRTTFRRRLVKFRQLQAQFQPEATPLIIQLSTTDVGVDTVHNTPLYLPSSLPPEILGKCSKRLVSMETELRIGQCHDCLSQLRTKLCAKARLLKYKFVHVRHQAPNTRSRNLLHRIEAKINVLAAKYRNALTALRTLDPQGKSGWCLNLQDLGDQDLRCLSEAELPDAPTRARAEELQARSLLNGNAVPEGNRKVSWIWRGSVVGDSEGSSGENEFGEGWVFRFWHNGC